MPKSLDVAECASTYNLYLYVDAHSATSRDFGWLPHVQQGVSECGLPLQLWGKEHSVQIVEEEHE